MGRLLHTPPLSSEPLGADLAVSASLLDNASALPCAAPALWTTEKANGCSARNHRVMRWLVSLLLASQTNGA